MFFWGFKLVLTLENVIKPFLAFKVCSNDVFVTYLVNYMS